MKTPHRIHLFLAIALGSSALILGCHTSSRHARHAPVPITTVKHETVPPPIPPFEAVVEPSVTPAPISAPPLGRFSPGIEEIIKLVESGIDESVLLVYVENLSLRIKPTPEEIVYLRDIGTPESVIEALIRQSASPDAPMVVSAPEQPAPSQTVENRASVVITAAPQVTHQTVVQAPPQPTQVTTVIQYPQYYDSLQPYGSWINVSGYGLCWRPTVAVVNVNWRPYHDSGRWLYTDQGWYWQSDYSWGWAPFHYGRWQQSHSHGWVWAPGNVWAPAWVSWRYSDQYCGWAPLPPEASFQVGVGFSFHGSRVGVSFGFGLTDHHYTFVGRDRFCDPAPWRHFRPRSEGRKIYDNSTVINNYYVNSNNTVVNGGIGYKEIARVSRTEVRKVTIRDIPLQNSGRVRPDRIVSAGSESVVYRPRFPENPSGGRTAGGRDEFRKTEASEVAGRGRVSVGADTRGAAVAKSDAQLSQPSNSRSGVVRGSGFSNATARSAETSRVVERSSGPSSVQSRQGTGAVAEKRNSEAAELNPSAQSPAVQSYGSQLQRRSAASLSSSGTQSSSTASIVPSRQIERSTVRTQTPIFPTVQNSPQQSSSTPAAPVQRRERLRSVENMPLATAPSTVSRARESAPSVIVRSAPVPQRPAVRTEPAPVTTPRVENRSFSRTEPITTTPSATTRFESRKSAESQNSIRQSVPQRPSVQTYTPAARPSVSNPEPTRSRPEVARSAPQTMQPAPSVRQSSPTITTTPSRQGPPPVQINQSQITPSSRGSGTTVPSRSSGSANERRGTSR